MPLHQTTRPFLPSDQFIPPLDQSDLYPAAFAALESAGVRRMFLPSDAWRERNELVGETGNYRDSYDYGRGQYVPNPASPPSQVNSPPYIWIFGTLDGLLGADAIIDGWDGAANPLTWQMIAFKAYEATPGVRTTGIITNVSTDPTVFKDGLHHNQSSARIEAFVGGVEIGEFVNTDVGEWHLYTMFFDGDAVNNFEAYRDVTRRINGGVGANHFSGGRIQLGGRGLLTDTQVMQGYYGFGAWGNGLMTSAIITTVFAWLGAADMYDITAI